MHVVEQVGLVVGNAMSHLVGYYVVGCGEAFAVDHLLAVPEGVLIGAGGENRAVAHGGDEIHTGVVQAIPAMRVPVEVIRIAGVVVGVVHVGDTGRPLPFGADRTVAGQAVDKVVLVVIDQPVPGRVNLVEVERDYAEMSIHQDQFPDGAEISRLHVHPPDQGVEIAPQLEQNWVVDP